LLRIPKDKRLPLIHGQKNHVLFSFIVSNDYIHFGELTVLPNQHSEFEEHKGEEVLRVLKGELLLRILDTDNPEMETKNASRDSYRAGENEKIFIPEGTKHRYVNLGDEPIKVFFAVAPKL